MAIVLKYLIIEVSTVRSNHFIDTGSSSVSPSDLQSPSLKLPSAKVIDMDHPSPPASDIRSPRNGLSWGGVVG